MCLLVPLREGELIPVTAATDPSEHLDIEMPGEVSRGSWYFCRSALRATIYFPQAFLLPNEPPAGPDHTTG